MERMIVGYKIVDKRHLYTSARIVGTLYEYVRLIRWNPVTDEYQIQVPNGEEWMGAGGLEDFVI